ncbi:MAG: hypothetical protein GSR86_02625 [Desulfurococcales archaeon]|nr:hypothetical protein [Desulfurococcales archaeon]
MRTLKITVYAGYDWRSRLAVRVVREAGVYIAGTYGIPVDVEVVEVPVGDVDAESSGVPTVILEGRRVSSGSVPSLVDIVDEAFRLIEEEVAPPGSATPILAMV